MRVISQWKDIDIDYESSSFLIKENDTMRNIKDDYMIVGITKTDDRFALATYSTLEKAKKALTAMSNNYIRYLITDTNNLMSITDGLNYELDKSFKKIEIKEIKATVYQFPEEDKI